ncbi:uncharacterized protein LOC101864407 [Aplysia californica]|uniref:chitin synthase n=1 Tax=Aplysia californica TaxID=6500 RepID=A0ABM1A566_APLCA|nr:uncharacterized protein LOC101864407 [Aplysia californica]
MATPFIFKALFPAVLFVSSMVTLVLQKSSLLFTLDMMSSPVLPVHYRYVLLGLLCVSPHVVSLLQLLWRVPLSTRSNGPILPPLSTFAKDCLASAAEVTCISLLLLTGSTMFPPSLLLPVVSCAIAWPLGVFQTGDFRERAGRSSPRGVTCFRTTVMTSSCFLPLVTSCILWYSDIISGQCAVTVSVSVTGLGYLWPRPLFRTAAVGRADQRVHVIYSLLKIVTALAFVSGAVNFRVLHPPHAHSLADAPGQDDISELLWSASTYVFIMAGTSVLFVCISFVSLSVCQPLCGITLPSICSTLISSGLFVALNSEQFRQTFKLTPSGVDGSSLLAATHWSSSTPLLCAAVVPILLIVTYMSALSLLPGSPRVLMAPFNLLFSDHFWSLLGLDAKLILSARGRRLETLSLTERSAESEREEKSEGAGGGGGEPECTLFVCATMYRETRDEMMTLVNSFRRLAGSAHGLFSEVQLNFHVMFDDGSREGSLTPPAKRLLSCLLPHVTAGSEATPTRSRRLLLRSPYGLQYREIMAGGCPLTVHFKDSAKVKCKKRWSQAMYMQYVLNYYLQPESFGGSNNNNDNDNDNDNNNINNKYNNKYNNNNNKNIINNNNNECTCRIELPMSPKEKELTRQGALLDMYVRSGEVILGHEVKAIEGQLWLNWDQKKTVSEVDTLGRGVGGHFEDWKHLDVLIDQLEKGQDKEVCPCQMTQQGNRSAEHTYILAVDGDTQFEPSSVYEMLVHCEWLPATGAVCGRIKPSAATTSPTVCFQMFEYAQDFWLLKSSQNVFGTVTCCPGCFSMFRASALAPLLPRVCEPTQSAADVYWKDTGEDRWLTVLMILQGWSLSYLSDATCVTSCPDTFPEFLRQRKRWILSDLANDLLLLKNSTSVVRRNDSISLLYVLYLCLQFFVKIVTPGCLLFAIAMGLDMVGQAPLGWTLVILSSVVGMYVPLCVCVSDLWHGRLTLVFSVVLSLMFVWTAGRLGVVMVSYMIESGPAHPLFYCSALLFLPLATNLYGAALHPGEAWNVLYWPVYILYVPTVAVLLPIYAISSIGDTRWGTRDAAAGENDVLCCELPSLTSLKDTCMRVWVGDDPRVDVNEDGVASKHESTIDRMQETATDMRTSPGLSAEFRFWEDVRAHVLGSEVNTGAESQWLGQQLSWTRVKCLSIYLSINVIVMLLQSCVYLGLLDHWFYFGHYTLLVSGLALVLTTVPTAGLTCWRLYTTLRHTAIDTYSDVIPLWRESRSGESRPGLVEMY